MKKLIPIFSLLVYGTLCIPGFLFAQNQGSPANATAPQPIVPPTYIRITDIAETQLTQLDAPITAFLYASSKHQLRIASRSGELVTWTIDPEEARALVKRYPKQTLPVTSMAFYRQNIVLLLHDGKEIRFEEHFRPSEPFAEPPKPIVATGGEVFTTAMFRDNMTSRGDPLPTVLIGTESGKILFWDIRKGVQFHSVHQHTGAVIALHPIYEDYFVSVSKDQTIVLWKVADGKPQPAHVFEEHQSPIVASALYIEPGGWHHIATGDEQGHIITRRFSFRKGGELNLEEMNRFTHTIQFEAKPPRDLQLFGSSMSGLSLKCLSHDGKSIHFASSSSLSDNFLPSGQYRASSPITAMEFTAMNSHLPLAHAPIQILGHEDGTVTFLRQPESVRQPEPGERGVPRIEKPLRQYAANAGSFHYYPKEHGKPDRLFVMGAGLFDFETGEAIHSLPPWGVMVRNVGVQRTGLANDGTMYLLSYDDGKFYALDKETFAKTALEYPDDLKMFPKPTKLPVEPVLITMEGTALIWDAADGSFFNAIEDAKEFQMMGMADIMGNVRETYRYYDPHVNPVISPNRSRIACPGNKLACVKDILTGETLVTLEGHRHDGRQKIQSIAWHPSGKLLATGGDDCRVIVWDAATGETHKELADFIEPVYGIAFSADGSLMATMEKEGATGFRSVTILWDTTTWKPVCEFATSTRSERQVEFTPDGRMLITLDYHRMLRSNVVRAWVIPARD